MKNCKLSHKTENPLISRNTIVRTLFCMVMSSGSRICSNTTGSTYFYKLVCIFLNPAELSKTKVDFDNSRRSSLVSEDSLSGKMTTVPLSLGCSKKVRYTYYNFRSIELYRTKVPDQDFSSIKYSIRN